MDKENIISIKGICLKDESVLLKQDSGDALEWALPGGKIELGETPLATLKRELIEELGKEPIILDERPIWAYSFQYQGDDGLEQITCIYYLVDFDSYDFEPQEEQLQTKFFPFSEIPDLRMNHGHKDGLLGAIRLLGRA